MCDSKKCVECKNPCHSVISGRRIHRQCNLDRIAAARARAAAAQAKSVDPSERTQNIAVIQLVAEFLGMPKAVASSTAGPIPILAPIDPTMLATLAREQNDEVSFSEATAATNSSTAAEIVLSRPHRVEREEKHERKAPEREQKHEKRFLAEREEKHFRRIIIPANNAEPTISEIDDATSESGDENENDSDYVEEESGATSESDSEPDLESAEDGDREEIIDLSQHSILAPAAAAAAASSRSHAATSSPSSSSTPTESQYKHPMFYRMSLRSLSQAQWLEAIIRLPILRQDSQLRQFLPVLEMAIEYLHTHEITTHFSRQRRQSEETRQLQLERKRQKKNNGRGLEMYTAMLFRLRGYDRTEILAGPHDGGIDVLAFRNTTASAPASSSSTSYPDSGVGEVATIQCGELRKLFDMDKVRAFHSTMTSKRTIQCKRKSRIASATGSTRDTLPIAAVKHAFLITSSTFPLQARQAIDEVNMTRMRQNHLNERILEGMRELQFLASTKLCNLCQSKRDKLVEQCEHRLTQQRQLQQHNQREQMKQSSTISSAIAASLIDNDETVIVGSDDLIRQFETKLRSEFRGQFHLVDGKVLLEWIEEIEATAASRNSVIDDMDDDDGENSQAQMDNQHSSFPIERAEVQMAIDSIKRLMMPMWHFFNPQFRRLRQQQQQHLRASSSSSSANARRPQKMSAAHKQEIIAAWPWQSKPVWDGRYHRGGDLTVSIPPRRGSALGLSEELQRRILEASELEDSVARVAASKASASSSSSVAASSSGMKRKTVSEMKEDRKQKKLELEAAAFRAHVLMEALERKGIRLPSVGSTPLSAAARSAAPGAASNHTASSSSVANTPAAGPLADVESDSDDDQPSQKRMRV